MGKKNKTHNELRKYLFFLFYSIYIDLELLPRCFPNNENFIESIDIKLEKFQSKQGMRLIQAIP